MHVISYPVNQVVRKHVGVEVSPHLYRHIVAKTVFERQRELALDVRRRLGLNAPHTTYGSYPAYSRLWF